MLPAADGRSSDFGDQLDSFVNQDNRAGQLRALRLHGLVEARDAPPRREAGVGEEGAALPRDNLGRRVEVTAMLCHLEYILYLPGFVSESQIYFSEEIIT